MTNSTPICPKCHKPTTTEDIEVWGMCKSCFEWEATAWLERRELEADKEETK